MIKSIRRFFSRKKKAKAGFEFVISEQHDDYHLQIPGTELGNLTIYYCTPSGCIDLATSRAISEYTVEVLVNEKVDYTRSWKYGDRGFGRFRIYANGTEQNVLGGYRAKCQNPFFQIRVTSPDTNGYTQKGRMKLMDDGTLKDGKC